MGLLNKSGTGNTTKSFEAPDEDGVIEGQVTDVTDTSGAAEADATVSLNPSAKERLAAAAKEREAEAAAEREAVAATKTTSLATKPANSGAITVAAPRPEKVYAPLENAFHVDWNTLESLKATQGAFMDKTDNKSLGDTIGFELLSHQKQFVISPGSDDEEDNKHVRYSDDGITTTTGEDCKDYLQSLLATGDFPDAKMTERVVLVGAVFDPGKQPSYKDKLMQISLAPTSKALFDRHQIQCSFNVGRGIWSPDGITRLRMTCVAKNKNKRDWTEVTFSKYDA